MKTKTYILLLLQSNQITKMVCFEIVHKSYWIAFYKKILFQSFSFKIPHLIPCVCYFSVITVKFTIDFSIHISK